MKIVYCQKQGLVLLIFFLEAAELLDDIFEHFSVDVRRRFSIHPAKIGFLVCLQNGGICV